MYYVYILRSKNTNRYYIGSTQNLDLRLKRHNAGGSVWTKRYKPWEIAYKEEFNTKKDMLNREKEIKNYKGGIQFKLLVTS